MNASSKTPAPLLLKDLIRQVRAELEDAARSHRASGRPALLQLESVTLEVNVTIKREESAKPGMEGSLFCLKVSLEGEHTQSDERSHKVIVNLKAIGDSVTPNASSLSDDPALPAPGSGILSDGKLKFVFPKTADIFKEDSDRYFIPGLLSGKIDPGKNPG